MVPVCLPPRCRPWPTIRSRLWNSCGAYEVAQKITVEDAHIRFDIPVFAVDRQIRACTPNPGAWCELHANAEAEPATLHVLRAQGADMSNPNTPVSLEPGRIVAGKKNVWVGTSSDPLELLEVKAQAKSHACRRLGAWRASRRSLLQVVSNKRIITILPCEHHHFTRQYRYPAISDFAISRLGSIGIRIIEECESTKKIKNPGQITFVHTMRSIRLNRQAWRRTPRQDRPHESSADHWLHRQPQQSDPC